MAFPFAGENRDARREVAAFIESLSEADFGKTTSYGWPVSAVIAHLAYWDQRMLMIMRRWRDRGLDASPVDHEVVNDAMLPLCAAIEPAKAVAMCLVAAEELDAELAALPDETYERFRRNAEATGTTFRMNRALHRRDHLADMQSALER